MRGREVSPTCEASIQVESVQKQVGQVEDSDRAHGGVEPGGRKTKAEKRTDSRMRRGNTQEVEEFWQVRRDVKNLQNGSGL
jgi:hypothetical protein